MNKWNQWYANLDPNHASAFRYSDTETYQIGADYLRDCKVIEDWGCGAGNFRNYINNINNVDSNSIRYIGLDGSNTPFAEHKVDLAFYHSTTEGIFMRHVLENNYNWRKILLNAIDSFTNRMILVIFTPFSSDITKEIAHNKAHGVDVPDISFNKDDLIACFNGNCDYLIRENISTATGYGCEHVFFLSKRVNVINDKANDKINDNNQKDLQKDIAIITAIYGDYDDLDEDPSPVPAGIDLYCFTNSCNIKSKRWRIITRPYHLEDTITDTGEYNSISKIEARLYSMICAKYYKMNSHRIDILKRYKYIIWIDASARYVNYTRFKQDWDKLTIQERSFMFFMHPVRNNIFIEADVSIPLPKYKRQKIPEQIAEYRLTGYNDEALYSGGFICRENIWKYNRIMEMWWREIQRTSYQDQLSLPYIMWLYNTKPTYVIMEQIEDSDMLGKNKIIFHNKKYTEDDIINRF
jgi:hypothetical protein